MHILLQVVDFWFWTLVPAIMLIGVVTAIPATLIIGLIVTGRARQDDDRHALLRQ